ncbi:breast cancer type 1 susceptibility protein homolog [Pectinophora gossypiella]|uniref:breast cancer type 1 susceptibility protein homolog n=1 Tax=Pectinophora gossypiella TaxID=13191 RepID=UPI00214E0E20|nr:breast cancer type 1 susceptibility protein homolog [Pectinophora gossypiella]
MVIDGLDPVILSKLTSQQVEQVTCIECCKYFIAPATAACGHSLCHACWKGRRSCHTCAAPVDKKTLKINIPLQTLTEHVHTLSDAFEKLFNVKLDEFALDFPEVMQSSDPTKNVKDWLASSQNHFSAPVLSSQTSEQDQHQSVELSKSKIQIHTHKKKTESPEKVVQPPQPQEDWDKIEVLPDTEDIPQKNKEHGIGPMDLEPFFFDEIEYSNDNPRRSSRKRELKTSDTDPPKRDVSVDKNSAKNSSIDTDKKSLKTKQTWNNVKKMRKEFSRLNKKNKSKLNVSIEMCKKAQNAANKAKLVAHQTDSEQALYNIDDNTPVVGKKQAESSDKSNPDSHIKMASLLSAGINEKDKEQGGKADKTKNSQKKATDEDIQMEMENMENIEKVADTLRNNEPSTNLHSRDDNGEANMNSNSAKAHMPFIKKSSLCQKKYNLDDNSVQITQNEVDTNPKNVNTDDIEISIKIGSTITNIVIKNKKTDVELKVKTDREVQTSLGPYCLSNKNDIGCSPLKSVNVQNIEVNVDEGKKVVLNKSASTKKHTASADTATATAQFEITDSVEKELSDVMDCIETKSNKNKMTQKLTSVVAKSSQVKESKCSQIKEGGDNEQAVAEDMEYLNDIDIFNSGSVKESNVKLLKDTKYAPSEILMPTMKSKKSQKVVDKRNRGVNDDIELPSSKKQRIDLDESDKCENVAAIQTQSRPVANDSEPMNYDAVMSQVFATIDAEIKNTDSTKHTQNIRPNESDQIQQPSQIIHKTQNLPRKNASVTEEQNISNVKEVTNQKYSENVFSMLDKDSEPLNVSGKNNNQLPGSSTQQHIENLLTPGMCRDLASHDSNTQMDKDIEMIEPVLGTPVVDNDDSDKSVVEETPQKNVSFTKPKQTDAFKTMNIEKQKPKDVENKMSDSQIIRSIINISDTSVEASKLKDTTVIDIVKKKQTLETPLTINKFVNHIKHNSTPVARKSLNFENENLDDPEQTLCPTTTQEKEFLAKAFEQTPTSPVKKPLPLRQIQKKLDKKYFVAGSCLSSAETRNLKVLCNERGWTYLDKYTNDLTHLVVGVDEENKSQRSVKYMCALAASKWIVSYTWVEKCLQLKTFVDELPYEALDACGEPGPRRSRTAVKKIFDGMTFYCMPPFSVLDVDTLKQMLTVAGGRVVEDPRGVKVTPDNSSKAALLLAEPEHTQEDRFVYLAMEHSVVPVNYEWALNCLGTYTVGSIHDLLLCPSTLLPPATANWPAILLLHEEDDD